MSPRRQWQPWDALNDSESLFLCRACRQALTGEIERLRELHHRDPESFAEAVLALIPNDVNRRGITFTREGE